MSELKIKDGTGNSYLAQVDDENRLKVKATTESSSLHAAIDGTAVNINSGTIPLTDGSVESSVLWFKNTDSADYIMTGVALGQNTRAGTVNNGAVLTLVRNPTAMSVSNPIVVNNNRNFAVSADTPATIYAGEQGATLTGGDPCAIFYLGGSSRLFATVDFIIPQGKTVGFKYLGNNTGAVDIYAAMIGHWES